MKNNYTLSLAILFSVILSAQVPQIERDALMALYNSTDGPNWTNHTNWGTSAPVADWHGITVENVAGTDHVITLNLPANNLIGNLPSELGNLSELTLLGFFNNQLSGSFPLAISNLTKMKALALDYNNFEGNIPSEYASLTALENVYFSGNNLSGDVTNIYTSMPKLRLLYLDGNSLTGNLDLSDNLAIERIFAMENNLNNVDLRNGNNGIISSLELTENPSLTCIFVDDKNNIPSSWDVDPNATYVETEAECDALGTEYLERTIIDLYPNPSIDFFRVDSPSIIETVSIYNVIGKLIKVFPSQPEYSIAELSSGIYIIHIKSENVMTTKKLIIK